LKRVRIQPEWIEFLRPNVRLCFEGEPRSSANRLLGCADRWIPNESIPSARAVPSIYHLAQRRRSDDLHHASTCRIQLESVEMSQGAMWFGPANSTKQSEVNQGYNYANFGP